MKCFQLPGSMYLKKSVCTTLHVNHRGPTNCIESWTEFTSPPVCHMTHIICHVSHAMCHMSCVRFHISGVTCHPLLPNRKS